MPNQRDRHLAPASIRDRKASRKRATRLAFDSLETRQLLTAPGPIVPGQVYQDVAFYDSNWDVVSITMEGPTTGSRGFTLNLAGDATNQADVNRLNLVGMTAENGLKVVVTPTELTITGGANVGTLWSSGYTNITTIDVAPGVTDLGQILLSGAIVNDIAMPDVAIAGITLDSGMTVFVDAANNPSDGSINISAPTITIISPITGEAEIFDESPTGSASPYNPTAGLIDLGNVEARSLGTLVVNGAISVNTQDPFDATNTTNDLRGVINVSGNIGAIVAPRSAMRNAIRAGGIGSIRLGQIDGEITTSDPTEPTTIYVPKTFTGFLTTAGHLNVGFTDASGALVTGNIRSGGGISGSAPSQTDPVLVPDKYAAPVVNTSTTTGIADISFNGSALSRWYSASSIGDVTAWVFEAGALFEAATDLGDVEMLMTTAVSSATATQPGTRVPAEMEGFFKAGGNIGNVKSATSVKAELIAGGNIGNISACRAGSTARSSSRAGASATSRRSRRSSPPPRSARGVTSAISA